MYVESVAAIVTCDGGTMQDFVGPRSIVRHSRLESFLKRHLSSLRRADCDVFGRWTLEERVVHYEGCVIVPRNLPVAGRSGSTIRQPFYAFVILTDRRLLLTELPPKKLKPFAELERISDIASVADAPPTFLFDPHREVAQRIRIVYSTSTLPLKGGTGSGGRSNRDMDINSKASSSNSSSDFSVVSSGEGSSNSNNVTDEVVVTSADVMLLLPSSDFGHVIYVTWIRRLTGWSRTDLYVAGPLDNVGQDEDGSARYQWLIRCMTHDKGRSRCAQLHQILKAWSSRCSNFANLVWNDARVLDWLASKLKQTATTTSDASSSSQELKLNPSRALAAILDFADRDVVWRILEPRFTDIVTWLTRAKKHNTISDDSCCELIFAILLLPCSVFSSKAIELILLTEWVVFVAFVAIKVIAIVRRSHVSAEDCLALFKYLFVLRRFLQLDESSRVVRYMWKNHSDELRYFGSAVQLSVKVFESAHLKSLIISMLTEIGSKVLSEQGHLDFTQI